MMRKSKNQYPKEWPEIAERVKAAAGYKCVRCGHHADNDNGYVLTVHHLDMNPANNEWWNLPALCQRCHLHIQNKVVMEQGYFLQHSEWFKPYVAGYIASRLGLPHHREYVMVHLEHLLEAAKQ
jgi:5-methylcytosine-specific restriction endonuclease McrA